MKIRLPAWKAKPLIAQRTMFGPGYCDGKDIQDCSK